MRNENKKKLGSRVFVSTLLASIVLLSLGPFTVLAAGTENGYMANKNAEVLTVASVQADPIGDGQESESQNGDSAPNSLIKARDGLNNFFEQFKHIRLYGSQGEWALVNLILAIIGLIMAIVAACSFRKKHRRIGFLIITIPIGIAGAMVFYLTENMKNLVVFVDSWTILGAVILIVEIIVFNLARK